jgi:L-aspartate oxidase
VPGSTIGIRVLPPSPAAEILREDRGMPGADRSLLQAAMTDGAGVVRDAASLLGAQAVVASLRRPGAPRHPAEAEQANLVTVAAAVLAGALAREESRGGHFRSDFPRAEPSFELRLVQGLAP